ncbi:MAG: hypothetical protein ACRDCE_20420, partial [Cetobacterium sp.]|uniref:hypothetical protein n=1 Tax=Cetobacterium sp. TaxID=2071632 RepID=UPI003EE7F61C
LLLIKPLVVMHRASQSISRMFPFFSSIVVLRIKVLPELPKAGRKEEEKYFSKRNRKDSF